jgi:putative ABC transport system permease protein
MWAWLLKIHFRRGDESLVQQHIRRLSFQLLMRDWRSGELKVLIAALLIAVTCVTSVVFFTDRIAQALEYQASELLAADLRIAADHEINPDYIEQALQLKLTTAQTISFRSMAVSNTRSQLAEVKAVSEGYPLRGALKISQQPFGAGTVIQHGPRLGELWIEPRLMKMLEVNVGEQVTLGSSSLKVTALIRYEPDRGGDMFSIAPRIMMNIGDLTQTGLVQEGSRMQYHLLVAGDQNSLRKYQARIKKSLKTGEQLEDVRDARKEVRLALERGQQFLGLSATVSVILAFVALAMAARRYAERHLNSCAILKCLGMRHAQIFQLFLWQLTSLSIVTSGVGCVLGYLAHQVLGQLAGRLILIHLPAPSAWPIVMGLSVGVIGLVGFALPPIYRLRHVPTLGVIRREFTGFKVSTLSSYIPGIIAVSGLVLWQSGSWALGWRVLAGLVATSVFLAVVAFGVIAVFTRILPRMRFDFRFAMLNLVRHKTASIVQLIAFGIGIMVLLLLGLVRTDLIDSWQNSLPSNASNRFVINIQPDQLQAVKQFFKSRNFTQAQFYPMVRGRWTRLNDVPVQVDQLETDRARRLATREFNLSWARDLQSDNKIIQGHWWTDGAAAVQQFSVEAGIAETLHLKLGDTMTFDIAGEPVTAKITSLRSVQWDTFRANFFVLAPPGLIDKFPASYFTSFYLAPDQSVLLDELVRQFSNLTIIDVSAVMNQVRGIMSRITWAVEYVFLFTLLAGVAVMYAAIHSTLPQRIRENAILRAIGASRRRLLQGMMTEFAVLGLLSGLLAASAASVAGYLLSVQVFDLGYRFDFTIWLAGLVAGTLGVGLAGVLGTRRVLSTPPLQIIQNF